MSDTNSRISDWLQVKLSSGEEDLRDEIFFLYGNIVNPDADGLLNFFKTLKTQKMKALY